MQYRLYKLRFLTPVRFGADGHGGLEQVSPTARADTLFSALCSEAAAYGSDLLDKLITAAKADQLKFTDLLPFNDEELYLPRPFLPPQTTIQQETDNQAINRKQLKQQKYLQNLLTLTRYQSNIIERLYEITNRAVRYLL